MKFKPTILLLAIVIGSLKSFAQNDKVPYVPPSPNASSLLEYASIPVSLNTGTAEISVPLFELKGRKLKVPVSISYHASGIKVQDLSSSVGLGWALNAGGVVTRMVRGIADESANGYFNSDFNTIMNDASRFATTESTDTEPDIFYYNFLGKTGRLVLDPNRNPIQLPENNLKITIPDFASADPKWEIVDTEGVKFVFGKTSNARETTTSTLSYPINNKTYISSWYLSEIVYPFSVETISFTYQVGSDVYFENYRQYLESPLAVINQCAPPFGFGATFGVSDIITKVTINSPKYISVINSSLGSVSLTYAIDRQDLSNAFRLSGVILRNLNNLEVKKFIFFNNDYFVSDGCTISDCKRLKLNKIVEATNGANIEYRVFQYNLTNLPSRKSVKYDHWGYYNNNSYSSAIPLSNVYQGQSGPVTFGGADKSPDSQKAQANILWRITNMAGGVQELSYELNDYEETGLKSTGGLRVSKITENDGMIGSQTIEKNYKYKKSADPTKSSGIIYRKNVYDYVLINTQICSGGGTYGYSHVVSYSTSLLDLFDIGGMHVNYSDVQVEYNNGAKELLYFTNFTDRPDDPVTFISSPDPDGPPFISKGDRSYERGLLKEHIYLSSSGKKVKRILNYYDFYLASSLEAPGGRIMLLSIFGTSSFTARRGTYKHTHRGVRLLETIEETYDQLDDSKFTNKRSAYTYNSIYSNAVKTQTNFLDNGGEIRKQYKYPMDYFSTIPTYADIYADAIYELGKAHLITPIETLTYFKNLTSGTYEVIEGEILGYKRDVKPPGMMDVTRLEGIFKLRVPSPIAGFTESTIQLSGPIGGQTGTFSFGGANYKKIQAFSSYDDFGNVLTYTPESGETSQYTWSTNNSLLASKTTNPGALQHQLNFTHIPLVGVTEITDPNARSSKFEFDNVSRLKISKDHDNAIVNRFRYHYKNATDLIADFSYINTPYDCSVSFSALVSSEPGVQYLWDFGDGVVTPNGGSTINHTYANGGTYSVKLAITHPEFPTAYATKTVGILPNLSVAITGYGTYRYINTCTPTTSNFTATLTATAPGPVNYNWEFKYSTYSTWTATGTNSPSLTWGPSSVTNPVAYNVRCRLTDNNGNYRYSNAVTVDFWCATGGGSGGGGNPSNGCATPNAPRPPTCDSTCGWNGCTCSPCQ